jgi:hypothetical protein
VTLPTILLLNRLGIDNVIGITLVFGGVVRNKALSRRLRGDGFLNHTHVVSSTRDNAEAVSRAATVLGTQLHHGVAGEVGRLDLGEEFLQHNGWDITDSSAGEETEGSRVGVSKGGCVGACRAIALRPSSGELLRCGREVSACGLRGRLVKGRLQRLVDLRHAAAGQVRGVLGRVAGYGCGIGSTGANRLVLAQ